MDALDHCFTHLWRPGWDVWSCYTAYGMPTSTSRPENLHVAPRNLECFFPTAPTASPKKAKTTNSGSYSLLGKKTSYKNPLVDLRCWILLTAGFGLQARPDPDPCTSHLGPLPSTPRPNSRHRAFLGGARDVVTTISPAGLL